MNKLDKQFEEMMKGVRIESPSSDFMLKVMSRVQAEAAVQKRTLLQNYQPVISRKTWIILITAFVLLIIYIALSGNGSTSTDTGLQSLFLKALPEAGKTGVNTILEKSVSVFTGIPLIAYLIFIASLSLWTLDSILTRYRHHTSQIQIN